MRRSRRTCNIKDPPGSASSQVASRKPLASTASTARRIATLSRFATRYSCSNTRSCALSGTELRHEEGRAGEAIECRQLHPIAQQPRRDDGGAREHDRIVDVALQVDVEDHPPREHLLIGQDEDAAEARGGHGVEVPAPKAAQRNVSEPAAGPHNADNDGRGHHRQPGGEGHAVRPGAPRSSEGSHEERRGADRRERPDDPGELRPPAREQGEAQQPLRRRPRPLPGRDQVPASTALSSSPRVRRRRDGCAPGEARQAGPAAQASIANSTTRLT